MNESERYEVLKNKKIQPQTIEIDENFDIDFEYLENNIKSIIEKPLIAKLNELGYAKKYTTGVIDIDFSLTNRGIRKSLHSQTMDYGGNFADFAKVILNLQKLLDSSVLIEAHTDKGKGTTKEKRGLSNVYVLFSTLQDNNKIIPVQFEVEQYVDNENRLYLSVALTKIETSVMGNTASDEQMATNLLPVSKISISDLFAKINPIDKYFLKYIPNQFLNYEQIEAKNKALEEEKEKYSNVKKQNSDRDSYSITPETQPTKDADGNKPSEGQLKYFARSRIRDKKGRLIPVYHGTKNGGFTAFLKTDEIGYFFARSLKTARTYANNSKKIFAPDKNSPEFSGEGVYDLCFPQIQ